ncbi:MAG: hypothetical protein ACLFMS_06860 [Halorhodospira sp.]
MGYRALLEANWRQRVDPPEALPWAVTIFAGSEGDRIEGCLRSLDAGLRHRAPHWTVVVNGARDDTADRARRVVSALGWSKAEVAEIPWGDKANAWNQYVYGLRRPALWHLFVDGYLTLAPAGLEQMALRLEATTALRAATGVPAGENSGSRHMRHFVRTHGGILGGLHALRGDFLDEIVERRLLIPWGLYRGDGLIGSFACHDLDPIHNQWDRDRVLVCEEARWYGRRTNPLSLGDWRRQAQRMVRQAQGRMENRAIRSVIFEANYEGLPASAPELMAIACRLGPADHERGPVRRILRRVAWRQAVQKALPAWDQVVPKRIGAVGGSGEA